MALTKKQREKLRMKFGGRCACGVDATADACRLVKEGKMDFTVCQNAVNQANAAVDVAVLLSSGKSIKDYAGTSDTGYQVWVDFEKVDAANVDKYIK